MTLRPDVISALDPANYALELEKLARQTQLVQHRTFGVVPLTASQGQAEDEVLKASGVRRTAAANQRRAWRVLTGVSGYEE